MTHIMNTSVPLRPGVANFDNEYITDVVQGKASLNSSAFQLMILKAGSVIKIVDPVHASTLRVSPNP
jgi:hypothetical protein